MSQKPDRNAKGLSALLDIIAEHLGRDCNHCKQLIEESGKRADQNSS